MSALIPLESVQSTIQDCETSVKEKKSRGSKRHRHHHKGHKAMKKNKSSWLENFLREEALSPIQDCLDIYSFERQFFKIKSIRMGASKIAKFGEKKLVTRGVSTCIAIAAVAFNHQNEPTRVGLAHFSGEGPNLHHFFSKMAIGDIQKVKITLVGGQGKSPEKDGNCREVLQAIATNPCLAVDQIIFNPWQVPDDWKHAATWTAINPSAAIAISEDGKVVVADETKPEYRNYRGGFTTFSYALSKLQGQNDRQG